MVVITAPPKHSLVVRAVLSLYDNTRRTALISTLVIMLIAVLVQSSVAAVGAGYVCALWWTFTPWWTRPAPTGWHPWSQD